MKGKHIFFAAALVVSGFITGSPAMAAVDVGVSVDIRSVNDFYEPLSHHGGWVHVERYGRCWRPAYIGSDWQPYSWGYWLWTDGGWFWVSDEPWGWATYHYGRWAWDDCYGWVWVPGIVWGPSWVSWREGGGYIGWAPLPPECDFDPWTGIIHIEHVVIRPHWYVFVEHRRFCEPIRRPIIVHNTIINQTVNITNIRRVKNVVINEGPKVDLIEREIGRKFEPRRTHDLRRGNVPPPIVPASVDRGAAPRVVPGTDTPKREHPEKRPMPEVIRGGRSIEQPPAAPVTEQRATPKRERVEQPPPVIIRTEPPSETPVPRKEQRAAPSPERGRSSAPGSWHSDRSQRQTPPQKIAPPPATSAPPAPSAPPSSDSDKETDREGKRSGRGWPRPGHETE